MTKIIKNVFGKMKHKSNNEEKLRAVLMTLSITEANKSLKMNRSVLSITEYNSIYREINNIEYIPV